MTPAVVPVQVVVNGAAVPTAEQALKKPSTPAVVGMKTAGTPPGIVFAGPAKAVMLKVMPPLVLTANPVPPVPVPTQTSPVRAAQGTAGVPEMVGVGKMAMCCGAVNVAVLVGVRVTVGVRVIVGVLVRVGVLVGVGVAVTALSVNVTSVVPVPTVTATCRPARFRLPVTSRVAGATVISDAANRAGPVSWIVTWLRTLNCVVARTQLPPGAAPAGTVTVSVPTVKVKFVPTVTPVPATLQTLICPVSV
jgi:hypothetical protein